MNTRTKIVCYDDNPDYGGHQVMAALAVEALARSSQWQPVFFCSPVNHRLIQRLQEIASSTENLELHHTPFTTRKLQGLLNRFSRYTISALRLLLEQEQPDLILCIQGEIEDGSLALCAAEKMHTPCLSYIPIPHCMALMGAKLGTLRDRLNAYLFQKPDGWITISQSMKALLQERGATAPIEVVHNGIDNKHFISRDQTAARTTLGLPVDRTIVGSIGRIEFNQKQQDFLIRAFADLRQTRPDMHLVITGDGPDCEQLKQLIQQLNLKRQVTLLPWQSDSSLVYSALDLLVIPSRFEGVPLVMLEALACGVPVIGSARDGMKDILPAAWTFETENREELTRKLISFSDDWKTRLSTLQKYIQTEYTVQKFQQNFEAALQRFLIMDR